MVGVYVVNVKGGGLANAREYIWLLHIYIYMLARVSYSSGAV